MRRIYHDIDQIDLCDLLTHPTLPVDLTYVLLLMSVAKTASNPQSPDHYGILSIFID